MEVVPVEVGALEPGLPAQGNVAVIEAVGKVNLPGRGDRGGPGLAAAHPRPCPGDPRRRRGPAGHPGHDRLRRARECLGGADGPDAGLFQQLGTQYGDQGADLLAVVVQGVVQLVDGHGQGVQVLAAYPGIRVTNGYGPSENTVFTTAHHMDDPAEAGRPLPIGRVVTEDEARRLIARGLADPIPSDGRR